MQTMQRLGFRTASKTASCGNLLSCVRDVVERLQGKSKLGFGGLDQAAAPHVCKRCSASKSQLISVKEAFASPCHEAALFICRALALRYELKVLWFSDRPSVSCLPSMQEG